MNQTFALVENPNCSKSSLFNLLTGSNQHVGNWPRQELLLNLKVDNL